MVAEASQDFCSGKEPEYNHRIYDSSSYNWCPVPDGGQDAILFASVAVCVACLAQGRFSNSIILLAGAAVQGFMLPYNLGRFGNGITIWLGIQPYELFFYIFLPPLLLDAAVRIDFFLFKKVVVQVITLAFLVVGGSVGIMIPIMLYVLDLKSSGWNWQYVSLFISMLASTDAVAIIATMKTSGGPKRLRVLLEGEALLNDASSFTLFEIFLHLVEQLNTVDGAAHQESGWAVFGEIVKSALKLAGGGLGIGLAFGIACRYILRFMRYMGATIDQQVSLTLALAYLSYYTANSPARCSGVVAVAVYGLYGAATSKWDMSAKVEESGVFESFWDTLSFVVNGIVFFFSGVACINFFVRSSQQLETTNHGAVLASTLWRLPLIYIFMFIVRFVLTALFKPMFKIFLGDITWRELLFATAAGLRGSVSLILAQAVVTDEQAGPLNTENSVIKTEIVLWTAGFVLMTLLINVPLLPLLLRKTGLSAVSEGKQKMRRRAVHALTSHTAKSIDNLKQDEDEMLRGVDWGAVEGQVTTEGIYGHFMNPSLPPRAGQESLFSWQYLSRLSRGRKRGEPKGDEEGGPRGLIGNSGKVETDKIFGRTKGWGSPDDMEAPVFDEEDEFPSQLEVSKTDEASDNEELNDLTTNSENDVPFLQRYGGNKGEGRTMTRSMTIGSFVPEKAMKRSTTLGSFARTSLLPTSIQETTNHEMPAGPVDLDGSFKGEGYGRRRTDPSDPTPAPPTDADLQQAAQAQPAGQILKEQGLSAEFAEGANFGNTYVMTVVGPLMAPFPTNRSQTGNEAGTSGQASQGLGSGDDMDHDSSMPKLRISGEALRKLVAEGTSGKTWPRMSQNPGGGGPSGRPPLPFLTKRASQPKEATSPPADRDAAGDENEEANSKTWAGPRALPSHPSTMTSTSTWHRSVGAGAKPRPSVFDAFDIQRPTNRHAQKTVAKHHHIFEAFGATDSPRSAHLGRSSKLDSVGSFGSGGYSETTSPQQTWTAGMTKGVPPKELIAQLKRQRSAPSPEGEGEEGLPQGLHPLDVLRGAKAKGDAPGFPGQGSGSLYKDSAGDTSLFQTSAGSAPFSDKYKDDLDTLSSAQAPPPMGHLSEVEIAEARMRLVVGLKRYFHGKRVEGLLSTAALRILDNACDSCLEDPKAFDLWASLEKDATGSILVTWLAHQTFFWRKVVLALRRRKGDGYQAFLYFRRGLAWPIRKMVGLMHHILTGQMLIGIEVAIEYMLGLTYSPQVQLLKRHETAGQLLDEIQDELDKVWKFILDREVEAPERFQAIQTYRATTAVLKQQMAFVKSMYDSGIVDDLEHDELLRPVETRERHLERIGPVYKTPTVIQTLHNLPFLRHAPNRITEILYRHGRLHMYRSGTDLLARSRQSLFVVTSGLVKMSYTDPFGSLQEYFLASGGMLGLYTALTGECMPGHISAIAEGNAMGKGPVVFELYQSGIKLIRKQAAGGSSMFQQIELDMMRLAAIYTVERMKPRLMPYFLMLLSKPGSMSKLKSGFLPRQDSHSDTPRSNDGSTAFTSSSAPPPGGQSQLRDAVLQQYTRLQQELAASDVLELPAGVPYLLRSSAVLLKGTLKVSGRPYVEGKKGEAAGEAVAVEYHAPFVFPFLGPGDGKLPGPPLRFVAGYNNTERSGALLMVCQHERGTGEGEQDAEASTRGNQGDDEGSELNGLSRDSVPSMKRVSQRPAGASLGTRPNLRRASQALILNVHDTAEHTAAGPSSGRKSAWYEGALARPSAALHRMSMITGKHQHEDTQRS